MFITEVLSLIVFLNIDVNMLCLRLSESSKTELVDVLFDVFSTVSDNINMHITLVSQKIYLEISVKALRTFPHKSLQL